MARGWKRAVELLLVRSGVVPWRLRSARGSAVVLAYHNIVPRGSRPAGDISLHVDQDAFGAQLDLLLETHEVVTLDDGMKTEASDRPRAVITFDDAYLGTLTAGAEELSARGLVGTVFVPPALLGADGFWWDLLAPTGGGPLDEELRTHALDVLAGRQERILAWAHEHGLSLAEMPDHARPGTPEDLAPTHLAPSLRLGAHTWTHPNLARLAPDEATDELGRAAAWLGEQAGPTDRWLTYPYGLRSPQVVEKAAAEYEGALLISGGAAVRQGHAVRGRHETPRVNVPRGMSLEGLALRLAGLLS